MQLAAALPMHSDLHLDELAGIRKRISKEPVYCELRRRKDTLLSRTVP